MSETVTVPRHLLELLQERLDPHRDAVEWGEVCALLAAPDLDQSLRADLEQAGKITTEESSVVGLNTKLPCEIKLPGGMKIGKGCTLNTLMTALRNRGDDVP